MVVDHDTFFEKLKTLFEECRTKSSIWLTHKRLTKPDGDELMQGPDGALVYPCLIRAGARKTVKFSTHVTSDELPKFHAAYSSLLKTEMSLLLRKRDKKREKQKTEEIARKRKTKATPLILDPKPDTLDSHGKPIGKVSKRGAGRRKRQRIQKMLAKRQESATKRKSHNHLVSPT